MKSNSLKEIISFFNNNNHFKQYISCENTIFIDSNDIFNRLYTYNNRIINFHEYDQLYNFKPYNVLLSSNTSYVINDTLYLNNQTLVYSFDKQKKYLSNELNSVAYISNYAFEYSNIVSIDFQNVSSIGKYAFENCNNLSLIDCKNVKLIEKGAFYNNCNLISIINMTSDISIHYKAFEKCNICSYVHINQLSNITIFS